MFCLKTPRIVPHRFDSYISSTEMHGTVSLAELNWFYHTCTSFSHSITATNL
nr:MAG TPA: hypothetical protein [Caudoviricetes sp.]